jgi:GntR family transcriptional regulator, transcriptional repressor for pyruvate dehydrogenase complex
MKTMSGSSKFEAIFKGIHKLIEEDGLRPGDRLPSERELSERLNAGRSSVREVLRSLELLGLISTRRGEGTFLEPVYAHQFVDLLAGFILKNENAKKDVMEMRMILEIGAVRLIQKHPVTKEQTAHLEYLVEKMKRLVYDHQNPKKVMMDFHAYLIKLTDNYLLTRVWHPVVCFEKAISKEKDDEEKIYRKMIVCYEEIVDAIKEKREWSAISCLERLFAAWRSIRTGISHHESTSGMELDLTD